MLYSISVLSIYNLTAMSSVLCIRLPSRWVPPWATGRCRQRRRGSLGPLGSAWPAPASPSSSSPTSWSSSSSSSPWPGRSRSGWRRESVRRSEISVRRINGKLGEQEQWGMWDKRAPMWEIFSPVLARPAVWTQISCLTSIPRIKKTGHHIRRSMSKGSLWN